MCSCFLIISFSRYCNLFGTSCLKRISVGKNLNSEIVIAAAAALRNYHNATLKANWDAAVDSAIDLTDLAQKLEDVTMKKKHEQGTEKSL